jgi:hypothetical protein
MLLLEDGTLTAERRHDCIAGVCYAMGFLGHHICHRGGLPNTPHAGEKYCFWEDGKSPQERFEEDYPKFTTDWRTMFSFYTFTVMGMIDAGKTVDQIILSWNPREVGRLQKVASRERLVREALVL